MVGLAAAGGLLGLGHRGPVMAPDFAVPDLRGQAVRLSAYRGKVVLLNLWTTWCAPCREEMPSMERLYQRLRGRDFELLAVSQDEDGRPVVESFVRELGLSFPVLVDPDRQVGDRYEVTGYPETFLIDRNGRLAEHVIGPRDWVSADSLQTLESLIAADGVDAARAPAPHAPS